MSQFGYSILLNFHKGYFLEYQTARLFCDCVLLVVLTAIINPEGDKYQDIHVDLFDSTMASILFSRLSICFRIVS